MQPKKIIRDKVVKNLKPGEWEELDDLDELNKLYKLKILEELAEVERSNGEDIKEFADLLDAVYSFAAVNGFMPKQLLVAMHHKRQSNGMMGVTILNNLNPNNASNRIYFEEALLQSNSTIDTVGKCANCGKEFHIHKL